jgi:hypothetical protein
VANQPLSATKLKADLDEAQMRLAAIEAKIPNLVDVTSNQSIGGNKTFTGTLTADGSGLTSLNGANIVAGSITATQVSPTGGIYSRRVGLYNVDKVVPNVSADYVADTNPCNGNDLPISGGCFSDNPNFAVVETGPDFVGNARWHCRWRPISAGTATVTARVVCYPHP